MAKTRNKKKKTANPVATIARKTVGLMARVGDALEAVAAAAVPATPIAPAVPLAVMSEVTVSPVAVPEAASTSNPLVASPVSLALAPDPPAKAPPASLEPSSPRDVAMPGVTEAVRNDARAIEAVEAYAAAHNLRAIDMPSRGTLVDVLTGGMVQHGSKFTDSHVLSLLDEQMRIHLRTLGARTVTCTVTPPRGTGS